MGTSQKVVWVFGIGSVTYKIYFIEFLFIIKYKPIGAAPRGHFYVGGGRGRLGKKGCHAPRATDFREERNPPQADSIVRVY